MKCIVYMFNDILILYPKNVRRGKCMNSRKLYRVIHYDQ